jgi:hypothetical protein
MSPSESAEDPVPAETGSAGADRTRSTLSCQAPSSRLTVDEAGYFVAGSVSMSTRRFRPPTVDDPVDRIDDESGPLDADRVTAVRIGDVLGVQRRGEEILRRQP